MFIYLSRENRPLYGKVINGCTYNGMLSEETFFQKKNKSKINEFHN